ncbi:ribosomal L1 domain-containing protein 1-like [Anneissia japonica]|uniref:ribosomal L1 domain-containing protein 1-like n=1 Tax=Anneissia japonica TaxID=1529436 RepID=UPI0014258A2A|nr:ribosomal L1 domain-containing protein 1-like [Anneissia japonica]
MACPTKQHVDIVEFRKSRLNTVKVRQAVLALFSQHKLKQQSNSTLFSDEKYLQIQLTTWKISGGKKKLLKINLPHPVRSDDVDICLISRDEPGKDSESCIQHVQDLFQEKGVSNIKEVIPLKDLIAEYKSFESRRKLVRMYDMFLADKRIFHRLAPHTGKEFYKRNKYPIRVDMEKFFFHSSMCVATTEHSVEDAVDNVIAAVEGLTTKISNGWNNIKALHLKVEHSIALPIHESLVFEDWWAENKIFKEDIQKMKRQLTLEKRTAETDDKEEVSEQKKARKKVKRKTK